MKIKTGFFSFTCCEGCMITIIEALNTKYDEWISKIDIVNFRALKKVQPISEMDIAFVEGAISSSEEISKLKEIRNHSKKLVALGSGASNGYPSNFRNSFNKEQKNKIKAYLKKFNLLEEVQPLEKYVKVDEKIEGCPINKEEFIKKMDDYLNLRGGVKENAQRLGP